MSFGEQAYSNRRVEQQQRTQQFFDERQKNAQTLTKMQNLAYVDTQTVQFVIDQTVPQGQTCKLHFKFDVLIKDDILQDMSDSNCVYVQIFFGKCLNNQI